MICDGAVQVLGARNLPGVDLGFGGRTSDPQLGKSMATRG